MKETPKYEVIANYIRQQIISGDFQVDDRLPQELVLTKAYNVSRITIRKALDLLENEGLIYRIQGSGTFVKTNSVDPSVVSELAVDVVDTSKFQLTDDEFTVLAPEQDDAKLLGVSGSSVVYKLSRVFLGKNTDKPYLYQELFLPLQYVQGVSMRPNQGSIYEFLVNDLDLDLVTNHREYSVRTANKTIVGKLELSEAQPVLQIVQTTTVDNGNVILLSKNWFNEAMGPFETYTVLK